MEPKIEEETPSKIEDEAPSKVEEERPQIESLIPDQATPEEIQNLNIQINKYLLGTIPESSPKQSRKPPLDPQSASTNAA